MEDYIITSLSKSEKNMKVYLIHIFNYLCNIRDYNYDAGYYAKTIEGLYQDFYFKELIDNQWGYEYLTEETRRLCLLFHIEWKKYVYEKPYGGSYFVYFDHEWYNLVEEKLMPGLESLDKDLKYHNIEIIKFEDHFVQRNKFSSEIDLTKRPSDNDIIRDISFLHKLLLTKGIIQKPYMGED